MYLNLIPSHEQKTVKKLDEVQMEPDLDDSQFVTTKLELAVAYIDMADKEGALELLNEVLQEGNLCTERTALKC